MDQNAIAHLIIEYRYWILIPLSFAEGPITAFIAGTLAALGYFNVYVLGVFFLFRDVSVDLIMYAIGYYGGKTAFVKRMLVRFGITDKELDDIRHLWNDNAGKTMFFSKLSYGVAAGFIMIAGMVEMPLKKFVFYGFLVACAHYGTLLILGYFLGNSVGGSVSKILENIQYVIGGATLIIGAYFIFKRWVNKRLRAAEAEEEKKLASGEESK